LPNFIKIGQSVAEIWRFFHFQDGGRPPSWIFKIAILNVLRHKKCQCASPCQISSKSVKWLRTYCDITVFQNGGRRHLGLPPVRLRDQICVSLLNFIKIVNPLLRYGDFSIFQDGGRPPSWIFKIAILNVLWHKKCQCASPCQISSKSVKWLRTYCDITVFQNGGRRHLGLSLVRLRDQICLSLLNFIKIGRSVAEIWRFVYFSRWRPSTILDF